MSRMSSGDDQRSGIAEAPGEDQNGSFDPGPGTDYLSRGPREHELDVDQGAQPFDPGPEVQVDSRRARRAERKREKSERKERERRERAEAEREEQEAAERRAQAEAVA